jgi:hypothetical protein
MIRPKSQGALLKAIVLVALLLSGAVSAGGLNSVLKEVNRFEKKLKNEKLLDEHEDLYFSFKKGVIVHDKWKSKAIPVKIGKYRILLTPEQKDIWPGNKTETKKFINEETQGIKSALEFYKSKPFKLEQMNASGHCFKKKDIDTQKIIVDYSKDLISLHHMSDIYDSRGLFLSSLKNQGFDRVSLSTINFDPKADMHEYKELRNRIRMARPSVKKLVKNKPGLFKCYRLFKV